MSKIALEGNASGTGTLTIASQNTNTNYTITLPNETGTVITSGTTTGINANAISTGTVAVARGGTGAGTLTAESVVIGNGTSAVKFVDPGTSGNVLTSNGTAWASQALASASDYVMNVYSTPGTWTKPAGLKAIKVTVVGGGGGSAGQGVPNNRGGGGGGGGASIEYIDAPAIPGPQPYTVGAGGTAGPTVAPGVGGTGGTSSFGGPTAFLSATGGSGGVGASPIAINESSGGTGSNGQLNIPGSNGGNGTVPTGTCTGFNTAFRGGSILGPTTGFTISAGNPIPTPAGYGVGGLGIAPPNAGVAGTAGVIIVEEFY